MITLSSLWPKAQVRELQSQNKELRDTLNASTDKADKLRSQLVSSLENSLAAGKDNIAALDQNVKLRGENRDLKDALKTAIDDAARLRVQLGSAISDAAEARKNSETTLKKMVNFQMLAAGSKVVMFEDVGPQPAPRPQPVEMNDRPTGRVNASVLARQSRANYIADFMKSQSSGSEPLPYDEEVPDENKVG